MKFCKFVEEVKAEVEKLCGQAYDISVQEILKNNGCLFTGLAFNRKGEEGTAIRPTVYLEAYYDSYVRGDTSVDDAARKILDSAIDSVKSNPFISSFVTGLADFEKVKDKIHYRLVNQERNQELLETVPFVPYCDLAMVFYLLLGKDADTCMTARISRRHMEIWKTDVDTLYRLAKENTPRISPPVIRSMNGVMKEIARSRMGSHYDEEFVDGLLGEMGTVTESMYILTNQMKTNGAAVILYDGVLRDLAEKMGSDLIILPSSCHEVITIPYKDNINAAELETMVRSINSSEVLPEDVLSGSVYWYSRGMDSVHVMSANGLECREQETDLGILDGTLVPGCAV